MRYNELFEDSNEDLIQGIQQNCQKILEEYQDFEKYMYRGIPNTTFNYKLKKSPENRKPRDTELDVHEYFNKMFNKFGYNLTRSNSVAFTTDVDQAKYYGSPCVVFPFDDGVYMWSQVVKDFADLMSKYSMQDDFEYFMNENPSYKQKMSGYKEFSRMNWARKSEKLFSFLKDYPEIEKEFFKYYLDSNEVKQSSDPGDAILAPGEVMFKGNYYVVDYNFFSKIAEKLGI